MFNQKTKNAKGYIKLNVIATHKQTEHLKYQNHKNREDSFITSLLCFA